MTAVGLVHFGPANCSRPRRRTGYWGGWSCGKAKGYREGAEMGLLGEGWTEWWNEVVDRLMKLRQCVYTRARQPRVTSLPKLWRVREVRHTDTRTLTYREREREQPDRLWQT